MNTTPNIKNLDSKKHEELRDIFIKIKKLLQKYDEELKSKYDSETSYDLWSFKDVEIEGRKRKEVYFAGLIIQKGYVGFYYMPIYTDITLSEFFKPQLLKLLKGKSCFHIKKLDDELIAQIEEALETGFKLYKQRKWV